MVSAPQIKPVGGMWMSESKGLRQFHSSWREAAEHINAVGRFRKLVAVRSSEEKMCEYHGCKRKQKTLSRLGFCDECEPKIQGFLSTHTGRKNPR
ncbi:hypothetical protein CDES_07710 [Corynebacterium deserti GIMN1.010]|uniref:Uncharacterized protein n=1 Tax=Corynebacterium deserti GIMN1.010 TaxID=931089 RepID=A0A0M4CXG3_9CORY|nr:hypothetical protein [Corynebacterium deserti]ALC05950.1 hypothetical protein CDES_07710 [Corynebacterium deserti GIMN1.010]